MANLNLRRIGRRLKKGKGGKAFYPGAACRAGRQKCGSHRADRTWRTCSKPCDIPGYNQRTGSNS